MRDRGALPKNNGKSDEKEARVKFQEQNFQEIKD